METLRCLKIINSSFFEANQSDKNQMPTNYVTSTFVKAEVLSNSKWSGIFFLSHLIKSEYAWIIGRFGQIVLNNMNNL